MPCFVGCLALAAPRFAILLVVVFSSYIGRAYETVFWPFLGFLFMPLTTLAYAWSVHTYVRSNFSLDLLNSGMMKWLKAKCKVATTPAEMR